MTIYFLSRLIILFRIRNYDNIYICYKVGLKKRIIRYTLFVNESILDINYPELLTLVIYDINAYKKCLKKLI